MKRAVFLYNPNAGRGYASARDIAQASADIWKSSGWECLLVATTSPGSATEQSREILERGCEVLFACGGDGTVHEVLQSLVGSTSDTALGIVPLGTGNVVAINLGLPACNPRAAAMQLEFTPRRVAAGVMSSTANKSASDSRYFIAAAGLGLHARMMAEANSAAKHRGGMTAYYRSGFRLLLREPLVKFSAQLTTLSGDVQSHECYELLALKIRQFGGIVRRWRPGSSLEDPHLTLMLTKTAARARICLGAVRCMIGGSPRIRGVEMISAKQVRCAPLGSTEVLGETDGEVFGKLPAELAIVPNAFSLLMPPRS